MKLLMGKSSIISAALIIMSHEIPYVYKNMKPDDTSKMILAISLLCYVTFYGIPFIYDLYMNKNFIDYLSGKVD